MADPTPAPETFRTIADVANELGLPQHVLHFWETRFPEIQPLRRGGGHRFYRAEDVALLGAIRTLLYERGLTIRSVQRMLREEGAAAVVASGGGGAMAVESASVRDRPQPADLEPPAPLPADRAPIEAWPQPAAPALPSAIAPDTARTAPSFWKDRGGGVRAAERTVSRGTRTDLERVLAELLDCVRTLDAAR